MIEDWIEKFEATTAKQRLTAAGGLLVLMIVVGVGINTILSGVLSGPHKPAVAKATPTNKIGDPKTITAPRSGDTLKKVTDANFGYLMPGDSKDWKVDATTPTFDDTKGVVKYNLKLTNAGVGVTISQQMMPEVLGSPKSAAFSTFINSNKPTRSVQVGDGTLYYLPALQNGEQAAGSDTVIYATNMVLMFGRSDSIVGWDGWSKLMAAMSAQ